MYACSMHNKIFTLCISILINIPSLIQTNKEIPIHITAVHKLHLTIVFIRRLSTVLTTTQTYVHTQSTYVLTSLHIHTLLMSMGTSYIATLDI